MPLTEPLPYMLRETRRARLAENSLLADAERWFEHCRMLRVFENKHLLTNPTEEDLRSHRVFIAYFIAEDGIPAGRTNSHHPAQASGRVITFSEPPAQHQPRPAQIVWLK